MEDDYELYICDECSYSTHSLYHSEMHEYDTYHEMRVAPW